jgi:hypothetical protein
VVNVRSGGAFKSSQSSGKETVASARARGQKAQTYVFGIDGDRLPRTSAAAGASFLSMEGERGRATKASRGTPRARRDFVECD